MPAAPSASAAISCIRRGASPWTWGKCAPLVYMAAVSSECDERMGAPVISPVAVAPPASRLASERTTTAVLRTVDAALNLANALPVYSNGEWSLTG